MTPLQCGCITLAALAAGTWLAARPVYLMNASLRHFDLEAKDLAEEMSFDWFPGGVQLPAGFLAPKGSTYGTQLAPKGLLVIHKTHDALPHQQKLLLKWGEAVVATLLHKHTVTPGPGALGEGSFHDGDLLESHLTTLEPDGKCAAEGHEVLGTAGGNLVVIAASDQLQAAGQTLEQALALLQPAG